MWVNGCKIPALILLTFMQYSFRAVQFEQQKKKNVVKLNYIKCNDIDAMSEFTFTRKIAEIDRYWDRHVYVRKQKTANNKNTTKI